MKAPPPGTQKRAVKTTVGKTGIMKQAFLLSHYLTFFTPGCDAREGPPYHFPVFTVGEHADRLKLNQGDDSSAGHGTRGKGPLAAQVLAFLHEQSTALAAKFAARQEVEQQLVRKSKWRKQEESVLPAEGVVIRRKQIRDGEWRSLLQRAAPEHGTDVHVNAEKLYEYQDRSPLSFLAVDFYKWWPYDDGRARRDSCIAGEMNEGTIIPGGRQEERHRGPPTSRASTSSSTAPREVDDDLHADVRNQFHFAQEKTKIAALLLSHGAEVLGRTATNPLRPSPLFLAWASDGDALLREWEQRGNNAGSGGFNLQTHALLPLLRAHTELPALFLLHGADFMQLFPLDTHMGGRRWTTMGEAMELESLLRNLASYGRRTSTEAFQARTEERAHADRAEEDEFWHTDFLPGLATWLRNEELRVAMAVSEEDRKFEASLGLVRRDSSSRPGSHRQIKVQRTRISFLLEHLEREVYCNSGRPGPKSSSSCAAETLEKPPSPSAVLAARRSIEGLRLHGASTTANSHPTTSSSRTIASGQGFSVVMSSPGSSFSRFRTAEHAILTEPRDETKKDEEALVLPYRGFLDCKTEAALLCVNKGADQMESGTSEGHELQREQPFLPPPACSGCSCSGGGHQLFSILHPAGREALQLHRYRADELFSAASLPNAVKKSLRKAWRHRQHAGVAPARRRPVDRRLELLLLLKAVDEISAFRPVPPHAGDITDAEGRTSVATGYFLEYSSRTVEGIPQWLADPGTGEPPQEEQADTDVEQVRRIEIRLQEQTLVDFRKLVALCLRLNELHLDFFDEEG
ncbi:unnamed protein product [Amoebophrya sp. A120]|nr:unnamed protein product [Amoebophrya sp. A120]|eukprot:GSA120T00023162001.1